MANTPKLIPIGFVALLLMALTPPAKKVRPFIDKANMDLSVKPGDNFYEYVNGNWLRNNPVPPSKTRWGSWDELRELSSRRIKDLMETAVSLTGTGRLNQMVGDFYASGMDSLRLDKLGYDPIRKDLQRIDTISSIGGLLDESIYQRIYNSNAIINDPNSPIFPIFIFTIYPDDKNAGKYIPHLDQGGITLPDRDYYIKHDQRSMIIRNAYIQHLENAFRLIGDNQEMAETHADGVLRIETALAKAQLSRTELRDPKKTYHKFSILNFTNSTPTMNWREMLAKLQVIGADSILTNNPSFFVTVDLLLNAVSLNDWKGYLKWNVINGASPFLSESFVKEDFSFQQTLTGQKQILPRWERISVELDGDLGDLVGQLYVAQYFKPEAKQRMDDLVNNLQQTFGERIKALEWMGPETKVKALEKLQAITKKIAYPHKWKDYQGVVIEKDDYLGNIWRCNTWAYQERVSHFGKPVDRTIWRMTPPTVNANYNPSFNEILFPAGILEYPFFDFAADDAINYGGIAAVIGHEMSHGFDDQGGKYDAYGNMKDWWTKDDSASFTKKANEVVNQFDAYTMLDTLHVNGKLTLGENIADLGGLAIAYEAFTKTPQFKAAKKIDGFTPAQRFFINWTQVWRTNILPERAAQLILTDPHSPGMYRAIAPLTNMDSWYAAFDVKEGDKMYKSKDQRTEIW
jgi:putative endopeptidase